MKRFEVCAIIVLLLNLILAENLDKQRLSRIELKPQSFYKNTESDESKKINPRSFYYNKHTKEENSPNVNFLYKKPEKQFDMKGNGNKTIKQRSQNDGIKEKDIYKLHYHRLINMLLQNIYIENDKSGLIEGTIGIEASLEEWQVLQNIESQRTPLKEIDAILSRVLHRPGQSLYAKTLISLSFVTHFIYTHQHIFYLLIAFITAVCLMIKFCTTKSTAVSFIIVCIISTSWYITHDDMIKEVMIKQKTDEIVYKEMPSSCKPQTMKLWYEKIWPVNIIFSESSLEDCEKYVQANLVPPLTQVTLLMSFSRMMSRFVFEPISVYGQTLNVFLAKLTSGMSTFKKTIVEMIVYFCHFFVLCLALVILFGSISIFTPLGLIKLEGKPAAAPQRIQHISSRGRPNLISVTDKKRKKKIVVEYNSASDEEPSVRIQHSNTMKKAVKQHESSPENDVGTENGSSSDSDENDSSRTKVCKKMGFKTKSWYNCDEEKRIASPEGESNDCSFNK